MRYEHPIGEPFTARRKDGREFTLVAAPSPTRYDKQWNDHFRVTCKGCVFCKVTMRSCSGHRYAEETCVIGGMKAAKCGAEYRADNQYIEFHRIKTNV